MSKHAEHKNYIVETKTDLINAIVEYKTPAGTSRYIPYRGMSGEISPLIIEGCLTQAGLKNRMNNDTFEELMYRTIPRDGLGARGMFIIAALHSDFELFNDLVGVQGLDDHDLPLAEDYKASKNYKPKHGSDTLTKFLQDQYLVLASVIDRGNYALEVQSRTPIRFTLKREDDEMKWHGIDEDDKVEQEAEAAYEVDIHEDCLKGFGPRKCFAMSVFAKDPYPVNRPDDCHLLAGFWWQKRYHLLTMIEGTSEYSSDEMDCEL